MSRTVRRLVISSLICGLASISLAEEIRYEFSFDRPMSWADDVVPWGLGGAQKWEIAETEDSGNVLRIAGRDYGVEATNEMRLLHFNHEPGAHATIRFNIRGVEIPEGASFVVRHYDGYCTGGAFMELADEPFAPFPAPLFDSDKASITAKWQNVRLDVGPLKHSVLTIVLWVRQLPSKDKTKPAGFVEYHLDNLQVTTEVLQQVSDPGFDWHGDVLGVRQLRASTAGAKIDWCDFADQEDVKTSEGKTIHYTLMQFRDTSTYKGATIKHNILHSGCDPGVGGRSSIRLNRASSNGLSAASWGIRQTVAYSALGLGQGEAARIRVSMKMTNEYGERGTSRVQLGVDPRGRLITQEAIWSEPYSGDFVRNGWHTAVLDFDRPVDAMAFTIYFRHRDGKPAKPEVQMHFPEPQSLGSRESDVGIADWVLIEVVK